MEFSTLPITFGLMCLFWGLDERRGARNGARRRQGHAEAPVPPDWAKPASAADPAGIVHAKNVPDMRVIPSAREA